MYETENSEENSSDYRDESDHALSLKFTIGYNSEMKGGVHNLTFENKKVIF
jgi:hypothetical protein